MAGNITEESVRSVMRFSRERFGDVVVVLGGKEFAELALRLGREDRVGLRVCGAAKIRYAIGRIIST